MTKMQGRMTKMQGTTHYTPSRNFRISLSLTRVLSVMEAADWETFSMSLPWMMISSLTSEREILVPSSIGQSRTYFSPTAHQRST